MNACASSAMYYKSGNKVKILYSGEYQSAYFIVAKYNTDKSIAECNVKKITFNNGQYISSVVTLNDKYSYKFMLWEIQQLMPLSDAILIDINTPNTVVIEDGYTDIY